MRASHVRLHGKSRSSGKQILLCQPEFCIRNLVRRNGRAMRFRALNIASKAYRADIFTPKNCRRRSTVFAKVISARIKMAQVLAKVVSV
jgi:hypothetical protein